MPSSPSSSKNWRDRAARAAIGLLTVGSLLAPAAALAQGMVPGCTCDCNAAVGVMILDIPDWCATNKEACADYCQAAQIGQTPFTRPESFSCSEQCFPPPAETSGGESAPPPVKSDCPPGTPDGVICVVNPLGPGGEKIPTVIGRILTAVLGVLGSFALLMFIYGGVTWLLSGGSPDKVQKGKGIMVWAILGMALIFASAALVRFVLQAFTSL